MIVLACLVVLALTVCNFFGFLSPQFPNRPEFLPQSSVVCEGRIARMSEQRLKGARLWVGDLYCQDGDVMRAVPGMAQLTVYAVRGEPVEPPPVFLLGDTIRFRSHLHTPHRYYNPGAVDWERKAVSEGVTWTGSVKSAEWVMVVRAGRWSPARAIDVWRQRLSRQIATMDDPNLRGTAAALLLGDSGLLPEKLGDGLRYLGVIHLYVISGLHMAVVAWAVYEILYWLLSRRKRWALQQPLWRWAAAGSLVTVWVYVGLVGGGVSVIRAGIMVSAYLAALILDRHPHVGAAIALAALVLILQSPHVIFIPGFQLSFVAVIALVTVYPRVMSVIAAMLSNFQRESSSGTLLLGLRSKLISAIVAALVATWATAPLVAYHFHQTPLLGIPANLLAGPYTTIVLMPMGLLWTLLAGIPHVSEVLQAAWTTAAIPLVRGIEWAASPAESAQWTFTPNVWEVVWWYGLLFLILPPPLRGGGWGAGGLTPHSFDSAQDRPNPLPSAGGALMQGERGWIRVSIWLTIGITFVSMHVYQHNRPHPLQITFLDVGQGASVLVELPNRHVMLIDGGGAPNSDFDVGRWVVAPALLARGITHVDELVLTHPHPDHYGGLAYIAERFHPQHFFTNGAVGEEEDKKWQAFTDRMRATGLSPEVLHRDIRRQEGDVQLIWRHPPATGPDESQGKNSGSLVTEIRYGDFGALIVGDIESNSEKTILQDTEVGEMSVLQVPHHASETSSSEDFLRRIRPQVAVAQLGFENRYGFPRAKVVKRYDELGIPLCRTDRDGAVTIRVLLNQAQSAVEGEAPAALPMEGATLAPIKTSVNSPTTQFSIQTDRSAGTCSARAK